MRLIQVCFLALMFHSSVLCASNKYGLPLPNRSIYNSHWVSLNASFELRANAPFSLLPQRFLVTGLRILEDETSLELSFSSDTNPKLQRKVFKGLQIRQTESLNYGEVVYEVDIFEDEIFSQNCGPSTFNIVTLRFSYNWSTGNLSDLALIAKVGETWDNCHQEAEFKFKYYNRRDYSF